MAEDRILCLALFAKKGANYLLKYIPDAEAYTDPVKNLLALMNQRRRWINGSWFALVYVLGKYKKKVALSTHSEIRKFFFKFSMWYAAFALGILRILKKRDVLLGPGLLLRVLLHGDAKSGPIQLHKLGGQISAFWRERRLFDRKVRLHKVERNFEHLVRVDGGNAADVQSAV